MASTTANGITIAYETAGDPAHPPVLLVMGLGGQLIAWPEELTGALAAAGLFVVWFDNRDVGRSTWFDGAGRVDPFAVLRGEASPPYLLSDMADDAAGLLDALGLDSAHVVGVSMGGMIAQQMAVDSARSLPPGRVRTMTSIMSTTGDGSVGGPTPEAMAVLVRPPMYERQAVIDQSVEGWRVIRSPGHPFDEALVRERAGAAFDRAHHPVGVGRQLAAILGSGDRTAQLGSVTAPTLVIHGAEDPLVHRSGGEATAAAIPGAELVIVPGMGHDLALPLCGELSERIAKHAFAYETVT